jgi:hypothetical protein
MRDGYLTRRRFLQGAAATGLAIGVAAVGCMGGDRGHAQGHLDL